MTNMPKNTLNKKNKISIHSLFALMMVVFIAIGTSLEILSYLAFFLIAIYMIFASNEKAICFMFFILPFSNIFKSDPQSTSFFTYLSILLVVKLICSKRFIDKYFIGAWMLLFAVQLIGSRWEYTVLIKQATLLLLIYGYFRCCKPIKKQLVLNLTGGLCISCCFAYMEGVFPNISEYMRVVHAIEISVDLYRFTGLYSDPNYLSQILILLCVSLFVLIQQKQISSWYWSVCSILIFWGIQTISKMFFLMLVIVVLMLVFYASKYQRYGMLVLLTAGIVIFLFNSNVFSVFDNVIKRLFYSEDISTGRFDIWGRYLSYLIKNPLYLLFGVGISSNSLVTLPHNTYLDFLYYYGIFGTSIFAFGVYFAVRFKRNSGTALNFVPAICFLMTSVTLSNLLMYDFAYILILIIAFFVEDDSSHTSNSESMVMTA